MTCGRPGTAHGARSAPSRTWIVSARRGCPRLPSHWASRSLGARGEPAAHDRPSRAVLGWSPAPLRGHPALWGPGSSEDSCTLWLSRLLFMLMGRVAGLGEIPCLFRGSPVTWEDCGHQASLPPSHWGSRDPATLHWLCFQPAGAHRPPSPFFAESLGTANGWGCRDPVPAPASSSVASSGQPAHVSGQGPGEGTPGLMAFRDMDGWGLMWGQRLLLEVRASLAGFRPGWADPASLDTCILSTREIWRWAGHQEGALSPGGTPRG